jgi:hypothetical protein
VLAQVLCVGLGRSKFGFRKEFETAKKFASRAKVALGQMVAPQATCTCEFMSSRILFLAEKAITSR